MAKVNKRVLIWSVVATLVICGLCSVVVMLSDSEPTAELSEAAATITATAAATETPTGTATNTATPPPTFTITPKPPTATPTTQPTETANDQAVLYFEEITPHILNIGEAIGDLGDLLKTPGADETWGWSVAEAMAIIRVSHKRLSKIAPPPEVAYIHRTLLDATQDCNDMTDHLTTALDAFDVKELDKAQELIISCVDKANEAQRMIEEFAGQ